MLAAATSASGFASGAAAIFEALSNDRYTGYRPKSVLEGVVQGISGLVVSPMRGIQLEGAAGFWRGLTFGILGVVFKPGAGVLHIINRVSLAIRSTIDPWVKLKRHRVRPPRCFQRNHVMQVYSYENAVGEEILSRISGGRYRKDEYRAHINIKGRRRDQNAVRLRLPGLWADMVLMATRNYLMYVPADIESEREVWCVSISTVRLVEVLRVDFVESESSDNVSFRVFETEMPALSFDDELVEVYNHRQLLKSKFVFWKVRLLLCKYLLEPSSCLLQ